MRQTRENVSPMSNEGRKAYVTNHLTEALLSLLAKKPLDDISISELVDAAGVGRASFYRNYARKEDILKAHIDTLFREWAGECDKGSETPLSEQVRTMIAHFEKHRSFYQLLNERGLTYLLKDVIIGICGRSQNMKRREPMQPPLLPIRCMDGLMCGFQRGNGGNRRRNREIV